MTVTPPREKGDLRQHFLQMGRDAGNFICQHLAGGGRGVHRDGKPLEQHPKTADMIGVLVGDEDGGQTRPGDRPSDERETA